MAVENLYASSHVSGTAATPSNALGSTSGTWTTNTGNTSWTSRFAMSDPTNKVLTGTHTVTVRARKESATGNPVINSIRLYQNGVDLGTIGAGSWSITSTTGQDITATFASSLVTNPDNIDIELVTTAAGGGPSARSAVQIDYIQWSGDFVKAPNVGTVSGGYDFAGAVAGSKSPVGTATGAFDLSGVASGDYPIFSTWSAVVTATTPGGDRYGSAAGGYDLSGTATGQAMQNGTASGAFDLAGSASGDVPPNQGSASGSFSFAGTALGISLAGSGSVLAEYNFAGSASGARASNGTASGSVDWSGSATGDIIPNEGTAAGSYALDGSAEGAHTAQGTASGTYAHSGTVTGESPIAGSASGAVAWAGSAAGKTSSQGAVSAGYALQGSASGTRSVEGAALGWFTFTATVVGEGREATFRFEPPTYQRTVVPPPLVKGPRYSLTESVSVVRVNGVLSPVKSPSSEQLEAAGIEGEDWFIGGHVYTVPSAVADELTAAGYEPVRIS